MFTLTIARRPAVNALLAGCAALAASDAACGGVSAAALASVSSARLRAPCASAAPDARAATSGTVEPQVAPTLRRDGCERVGAWSTTADMTFALDGDECGTQFIEFAEASEHCRLGGGEIALSAGNHVVVIAVDFELELVPWSINYVVTISVLEELPADCGGEGSNVAVHGTGECEDHDACGGTLLADIVEPSPGSELTHDRFSYRTPRMPHGEGWFLPDFRVSPSHLVGSGSSTRAIDAAIDAASDDAAPISTGGVGARSSRDLDGLPRPAVVDAVGTQPNPELAGDASSRSAATLTAAPRKHRAEVDASIAESAHPQPRELVVDKKISPASVDGEREFTFKDATGRAPKPILERLRACMPGQLAGGELVERPDEPQRFDSGRQCGGTPAAVAGGDACHAGTVNAGSDVAICWPAGGASSVPRDRWSWIGGAGAALIGALAVLWRRRS